MLVQAGGKGRMSRGYCGSGAYFSGSLRSEFGARPGCSVALSSSQTRSHSITTGLLDQGGSRVPSWTSEHSGLHKGADYPPGLREQHQLLPSGSRNYREDADSLGEVPRKLSAILRPCFLTRRHKENRTASFEECTPLRAKAQEHRRRPAIGGRSTHLAIPGL